MRTVTFNINYRTVWGETLSADIRGVASVEMHHTGDGRWTGSVELPDSTESIDYIYTVRRADGSVRAEWGAPRHLLLPPRRSVAIVGRWHDRPASSPFYSTPFRLWCGEAPECAHSVAAGHDCRLLTLIVPAPGVEDGQTLAIAGSSEPLGEWNADRAPRLTRLNSVAFGITMEMPHERVEWKCVVSASAGGEAVWEKGYNRVIDPGELPDADAVVVEAERLVTPLPLWRGSGVAIPVFSIRTEEDWGIGDFADIATLAKWAVRAGMSMIQILPVNDTTVSGTWHDSYPYNGISTFALNPMYLRPDAAGTLADAEAMQRYRAEARELNMAAAVNYEGVFALKQRYMRQLYAEQGEQTLASADCRRFVADNSHWLIPYAAFCLLRDRHHTADMAQWGEYALYDADRVRRLVEEECRQEAGYHIFTQYHLHKQLLAASRACHEVGIAIKGDIPIGISRMSVDAWVAPQLFNLNTSAGAPPDDFAILGQNWGFPTYNWEEMSRDGFGWWKARLGKMAEYFDAYRIDHVLGFFRIWQIPLHAIHGLLGVFHPALPLTAEQMRLDFGFLFDGRMTEPYITDAVLDELFGELAPRVVAEFLLPADEPGRYRLREEFATQRRVADHFNSIADDGANNRIYNGLLRIIDDVLFIADPVADGGYHPRICGGETFAFAALDEGQQQAYRRMYDDFYYHRSDYFWRGKALWKLPPLIDSTGMLCCAEDLGMIPPCVPEVMEELEILSLKVQRMPSEYGREFGDPAAYPYYSVCTTSTHDMGGIRQWWEENTERTARYFHNALGLHGQAPYYAEPWICDRIVASHLASPSMLCVLPLQDWLSIDGGLRRTDPREEQINDPANPANNWNYRMHLTVEDLLAATAFTHRLRAMAAAAGRTH